MKANIIKEVKLKGLDISLETQEEVSQFETILLWAYAWKTSQVNPSWDGLAEVSGMMKRLNHTINESK